MITNPSIRSDGIFNACRKRHAVKEMAARKRATLDAKLAKLRTRRLAEEEADEEVANLNSAIGTAQKKQARSKSPRRDSASGSPFQIKFGPRRLVFGVRRGMAWIPERGDA